MAKVFWLEPTDQYEVSLRRYYRHEYLTKPDDGRGYNYAELVPGLSDTCPVMPGKYSYHNLSVVLERITAAEYPTSGDDPVHFPHTDHRWPLACACGYVFRDVDYWQVNYDRLHHGAPDGQLYSLRTAPVGAMWDAQWMSNFWKGPDGICLVVKTPGGDWTVDGEASNCTDPAKNHPQTDGEHTWHERTHYCWVRHGDPRTGDVHVDKDGKTCGAGAGSILQSSYHGFLHHGHLTDC